MNTNDISKTRIRNPVEACAREWTEPVPLPHSLSSVKQLRTEMIPDSMSRWLLDSADRMQVPPDFAAAAAIVAFGVIIGRGCGIYPKRNDNWLVIPNLWGLLVGRPSLMKSPTQAEGIAPLSQLELEAREAFSQSEAEFQFQSKIAKISEGVIADELRKAIKRGESDVIENARHKISNLQVEMPARKRYLTQDATIEKIGELLIDNPRGLLVLRDELIGWLRSLDKDGRDGDRAFFLESWNGNQSYTYDRIGRGTLDVPAHCLSIFGSITPGPLSTYVNQATRGGLGDDGLLQRFQVAVWPDISGEWINVDRKPDFTAREQVFKIAKMLSGNIPGALMEEGAVIPSLRFDDEGQEIFDHWRFSLEKRLRSDSRLPPAMESHLTKYRKLMPSLALIFHLIEVADGNVTAGPVSVNAASMAEAWCEYLESHAVRIYGSSSTPGMEPAKEIIKHIIRGAIQDGCKPKDIYRHHWAKLTTPDDVKIGLELLEQYDWLCVDKVPTGGKPSEIVRLNPRITLANERA